MSNKISILIIVLSLIIISYKIGYNQDAGSQCKDTYHYAMSSMENIEDDET